MDFRVPELGEGVYEAELTAWLVKPGDVVKRGQNLMEVMTDKATMEVPSPFAGAITSLQAQPGETIKVGQPVLSYTPAGQREPEKATEVRVQQKAAVPVRTSPPSAPTHQALTANGPAVRRATLVKAAPSVRLMARKLGIDLMQVRGSGPEGRILIDDLTPPATGKSEPAAQPRHDYGTPGTRIKLQALRRKIAEHMVQAKRTIPHYSYIDECDVTELVRLRESLREFYAGEGLKLTYLAFVVKAVAAALKDVPIVNSSLDDEAHEIVLHDRYDIGVATAAPSGLIVPVVREADRKSLAQVAQDIERVSNAARAGKSRREDLSGSTFTVTSFGGIGGLMATPVINHPEVGILGIGKVVKRPVYDGKGNIKPADLVYLSFSFDHRVVDGAVGAVFGNAVIRRLVNPALLLLPEKLLD